MITAVDTDVLLDVFGADPTFGARSADALRRCSREGQILACEVVWAEMVGVLSESSIALDLAQAVNLAFDPSTRPAAEAAGEAWRAYRRRGGSRSRVIADFLIGAHALTRADRLLTRDRGFYRTYFPGLAILDPSR